MNFDVVMHFFIYFLQVFKFFAWFYSFLNAPYAPNLIVALELRQEERLYLIIIKSYPLLVHLHQLGPRNLLPYQALPER